MVKAQSSARKYVFVKKKVTCMDALEARGSYLVEKQGRKKTEQILVLESSF